ncbi:uncharacterized protein EI90DRAFT_3016235 [Cantharellus anzutake]|uniref:uncharacterized protein n=1 Tax=Cantharellus anzutake TaxID=1750568 RepID=UPI001903855E|nr:uncharacterized protein EI90DRAFT_3016235 [Cantharellus anzutake]KAF8331662.1 hypothetical protein EI90DRAFT_3016235 [Cantharellus anzutake]
MTTTLITFILAYGVHAVPILPHNISLSLDVSDACNDLRNCQTMWSIIYTCLLTIVACIWTAVHPNIRNPNDRSTLVSGSSRGYLMILALVTPEILLGGALGDFLEARRITGKCEMIKGWTMTHSFFVIMNGFFDPSKGAAVVPKRSENPLDVLGKYPGIIEKENGARKVIVTKEEILDRSKGDWFAKFIVILQLLWFIIHYIGRWAGHLHRSQLETMTLAYATLSVIDYMLWWHKPTLIRFPIRVTKDSNRSDPPNSKDLDADQPAPSLENGAVLNPTLAEIVGYGPIWAGVATGIIFGGIHCFAWCLVNLKLKPNWTRYSSWLERGSAGIQRKKDGRVDQEHLHPKVNPAYVQQTPGGGHAKRSTYAPPISARTPHEQLATKQ